MKKLILLLLCGVLLAGCASSTVAPATATGETQATSATQETLPAETAAPETEPAFLPDGDAVVIVLSDSGITVNGGGETDAVFVSHDIVYYEDRDAYESGNPYGEAEPWERHSAQEADAHTVVNITEPGTYVLSGKLSAGQIRVDLGKEAKSDPEAVVTLILNGVDITCSVAPAILFRYVYECDGEWSAETATANVDTSAAGANLILAQGSANFVSGSHVARIYKDSDEQKKLCKQDGAVYSYMSMNVGGSGSLDITADNEGLDTELHLTINGGNLNIRADNDGINTNEDGVSVTTINGGNIHIIAGLGTEGDGIDSNGYLVINGGTVVAAANPASDSGLDSDKGSFINGGMVVALGSAMDWAESDSNQVTMNLQFAAYQTSDCAIVVTREDGTVVFAYDPGEDEVLAENARRFTGAVISCPDFRVGETYYLYLDGTVSGPECNGFYDVTAVTAYEGGRQQMYTGSDVGMFGGHFAGPIEGNFDDKFPGRPADERPGFPTPEPPELPEGSQPGDISGEPPAMPNGQPGEEKIGMPGFGQGFNDGKDHKDLHGDWSGFGEVAGEGSTAFFMQDKVNAFSGITDAVE